MWSRLTRADVFVCAKGMNANCAWGSKNNFTQFLGMVWYIKWYGMVEVCEGTSEAGASILHNALHVHYPEKLYRVFKTASRIRLFVHEFVPAPSFTVYEHITFSAPSHAKPLASMHRLNPGRYVENRS